MISYKQHAELLFQSTLPYGSDQDDYGCRAWATISIHAPLRERLHIGISRAVASCISIHAPLRERLDGDSAHESAASISIHAPLRERLMRMYSL